GLAQELHGLLRGLLHRHVEIEVHPHRVIVGGILGAWPGHAAAGALVHDELERAGERSLDRGAVDLAVALHGVRIAGEELRAVVKYWQVEGRTDGELVEVHVAAPAPGRAR